MHSLSGSTYQAGGNSAGSGNYLEGNQQSPPEGQVGSPDPNNPGNGNENGGGSTASSGGGGGGTSNATYSDINQILDQILNITDQSLDEAQVIQFFTGRGFLKGRFTFRIKKSC